VKSSQVHISHEPYAELKAHNLQTFQAIVLPTIHISALKIKSQPIPSDQHLILQAGVMVSEFCADGS